MLTSFSSSVKVRANALIVNNKSMCFIMTNKALSHRLVKYEEKPSNMDSEVEKNLSTILQLQELLNDVDDEIMGDFGKGKDFKQLLNKWARGITPSHDPSLDIIAYNGDNHNLKIMKQNTEKWAGNVIASLLVTWGVRFDYKTTLSDKSREVEDMLVTIVQHLTQWFKRMSELLTSKNDDVNENDSDDASEKKLLLLEEELILLKKKLMLFETEATASAPSDSDTGGASAPAPVSGGGETPPPPAPVINGEAAANAMPNIDTDNDGGTHPPAAPPISGGSQPTPTDDDIASEAAVIAAQAAARVASEAAVITAQKEASKAAELATVDKEANDNQIIINYILRSCQHDTTLDDFHKLVKQEISTENKADVTVSSPFYLPFAGIRLSAPPPPPPPPHAPTPPPPPPPAPLPEAAIVNPILNSSGNNDKNQKKKYIYCLPSIEELKQMPERFFTFEKSDVIEFLEKRYTLAIESMERLQEILNHGESANKLAAAITEERVFFDYLYVCSLLIFWIAQLHLQVKRWTFQLTSISSTIYERCYILYFYSRRFLLKCSNERTRRFGLNCWFCEATPSEKRFGVCMKATGNWDDWVSFENRCDGELNKLSPSGTLTTDQIKRIYDVIKVIITNGDRCKTPHNLVYDLAERMVTKLKKNTIINNKDDILSSRLESFVEYMTNNTNKEIMIRCLTAFAEIRAKIVRKAETEPMKNGESEGKENNKTDIFNGDTVVQCLFDQVLSLFPVKTINANSSEMFSFPHQKDSILTFEWLLYSNKWPLKSDMKDLLQRFIIHYQWKMWTVIKPWVIPIITTSLKPNGITSPPMPVPIPLHRFISCAMSLDTYNEKTMLECLQEHTPKRTIKEFVELLLEKIQRSESKNTTALPYQCDSNKYDAVVNYDPTSVGSILGDVIEEIHVSLHKLVKVWNIYVDFNPYCEVFDENKLVQEINTIIKSTETSIIDDLDKQMIFVAYQTVYGKIRHWGSWGQPLFEIRWESKVSKVQKVPSEAMVLSEYLKLLKAEEKATPTSSQAQLSLSYPAKSAVKQRRKLNRQLTRPVYYSE